MELYFNPEIVKIFFIIVLHNVKLRYSQEQIYTYSGIVLIALNPFQRLPIYTHDIMKACMFQFRILAIYIINIFK